MENIYYKLFIGVISLLIQKTNKEKLSVIVFFSLLLGSPYIRLYLNIPTQVYYPLVSIIWLVVYSVLEHHRWRIFLLSFTNIIPYVLDFNTTGYLLLVEVGALAFFVQTKIDDYMKYLNSKLDTYFKNKLRK